MSLVALRARILGAMSVPCAIVACGEKHPRPAPDPPASSNAAAPALTIPSAAPSALGVPVLARTTGLSEPTPPWPRYATSPYFCEPASPGARPSVPAPFEGCVDPLRANASSVTRFSPNATTGRRMVEPDACCYVTFTQVVPHYVEGRPLVGDDGPLGAPAIARADWAGEAVLPDEARAIGVSAERWLARAASEHASVAAFSRAALALLAHGAPPELVREAHAAAIDEIDHARLAYAVAAALSGVTRGPAALDVARSLPLPRSIAALATETFRDGCVNETRAALAAEREALGAPPGRLRDALLGVAEDEARHAELAWRVLAWAAHVGGRAVARALAREAAALDGSDETARELVGPCVRALLQNAAASMDALR